jgi:hypothetical protein
MKRLLCAHPMVTPAVPGESRLMEAVAAVRPFLSAAEPFYAPARASTAYRRFQHGIREGFGDTARVEKALETFRAALGVVPIRGSEEPPQPYVGAVPEAALDRALGTLVRNLIAESGGGPTHVCEKTPSNAQFATLIAQLCPDARLVVLSREPIDVAMSHTFRSWGPADPLQAATYTRRYFERWAAVRKRLPEGFALEVRLSDLIQRPIEIMKRVLKFTGLPFAEEPLTQAVATVREPVSRVAKLSPKVLALMRSELAGL